MSRISENALWWGWSDARQNRAINEVESAARSHANRAARRAARSQRELEKSVRSEISGVQGRVEDVLNIIELRFQLAEFDEYQVRVNARKTFRSLAAGTEPGHIELFDVGGYWMPPAALAIRDLVQGTGLDMQQNLDQARDRDRLRTELLSLSAGICFDQQLLMPPAITYLLSQDPDFGFSVPDTEETEDRSPESTDDNNPTVAQGWRQLWSQSLRGEFGVTAQQQMQSRLTDLVASQPDELPARELATWVEAIWNFVEASDRSAPASVSEALQALKVHIEQALSRPTVVTGSEGDFSASDLEQWQHFLQELIEEPSDVELPVLEELEALRAQTHSTVEVQTWQVHLGSLREWLRYDALAPGAEPAQQAQAVRLVLPWLAQAAEAMVKRVNTTESLSRTVGKRSAQVTVTSEGVASEEVAKAERRLAAMSNPDVPTQTSQLSIAGVSVGMALMLLLAGQYGWALFVLLFVGIPMWRHYYTQKEIEAGKKSYARNRKKLLDDINAAKVALADEERDRSRAAARLTADLSAVTSLRSGTRSSDSSLWSGQGSGTLTGTAPTSPT